MGPSLRLRAPKRRVPSSLLRTLWASLVQLARVRVKPWAITTVEQFALVAITIAVAVADLPTVGLRDVGTGVISDAEAGCAIAAESLGSGFAGSSVAASVSFAVGGVTASLTAIAGASSSTAVEEDSPSIVPAVWRFSLSQVSSLTADLVVHFPTKPVLEQLLQESVKPFVAVIATKAAGYSVEFTVRIAG